MNCNNCERLQLTVNHMVRRAEQRPVDFTEKRRTADWMNLFDERADLKVEVNKLKRENGELLSRIAHLTQMLEEAV